MDIAIPAAPAGILTLLAFFAPYAVSALNGWLPFVKTALQRKLVSIVVALLLAALVIFGYYGITHEPITDWWMFALLAIVVVQASYALVTRDAGAKAIEQHVDPSIVVYETRPTTKH